MRMSAFGLLYVILLGGCPQGPPAAPEPDPIVEPDDLNDGDEVSGLLDDDQLRLRITTEIRQQCQLDDATILAAMNTINAERKDGLDRDYSIGTLTFMGIPNRCAQAIAYQVYTNP